MREPIEDIITNKKENCREKISSFDIDYLIHHQITDIESILFPDTCFYSYAIISLFEGNMTDFSKYCKVFINCGIRKKNRLDIIQISSGKIVGNLSDVGCTEFDDLAEIAFFDLRSAIFLFFDDPTSPRVTQHLNWVVESTDLPPGTTDEYLLNTYTAEFIPKGFAVRGYALMMLGRYQEATESLNRVLPLTRAAKLKGEWMVYQADNALPYALIPLCEYLYEPTEQRRIAAWKGRDKYMKQIINSQPRFDSYLYYFHLEKAYPDVYLPGSEKKKIRKKMTEKENTAPEVLSEFPDYPESTRDDEPSEGGVVIQDTEDNEWRFVLRVPSFERFISKIQSLSGYPVLSDAITAYTFSTSLDPAAVISECNGLLKEPSLTIEEREAVGEIGKTAMHARDHGACVEFLFNEYW